jgi:hypothetical protein
MMQRLHWCNIRRLMGSHPLLVTTQIAHSLSQFWLRCCFGLQDLGQQFILKATTYLPLWHILGGVVWIWAFFAHFCNMSSMIFNKSILHHLVLIIKNTFSHILICMLDEIIKKMILVLHSNQFFFLLPKIRSSNLETQWIELCWSKLFEANWLSTKWFHAHAIPLLGYIINPLAP